ncbi:NAD-dependent epimerase/dehydratase family protein [Agromyces sp. NPDC058110]|uniref:NAD-dependent epimerase/dehydratase family protein n=1 Tax=Agromyces sp. NPDC058110 TaxID=3346345 RepID=UPI0036D87D62
MPETQESGTVLVTGGRGRLGRLFVRELRSSGLRAVSLGRTPVDGHPDDVVVDLRDAESVADVVRAAGADTIVHLASVLHGDDLVAQNRLIDAAVAGAALAIDAGRIIHVSSAAVYGTASAGARHEDSELAGDSAYARSKIEGEALFRRLAADSTGTAVTTLRIFNVAGPDFPDSLVHKLATAAPRDPVTVVAPDHFIRDYIHQQDVSAVLLAATNSKHQGHRVLNVGAGAAVSTRMLLQSLRVDGSSYIERAGAPSSSWADVSRMRSELGVSPTPYPTLAWESAHLPR